MNTTENFEYKEEYGWLTNICLNVTDACNLCCRYCFVEQNPHFMTLDVAKDAVRFILNNLEKKLTKFPHLKDSKQSRCTLAFFGGEPTLMWDEIIAPLTLWIRENNFPINLSMTTNGTLLNEERIKFLKNNEVGLLLSIDGAKETQDYNRPCHSNVQSSFDLIKPNMPLLLKLYPNLTFRSTIYAPTAHKVFENFLFALNCGFKNIFMVPDSRHAWTEQQIQNLKIETHKIFSFLYAAYFSNNKIPSFSCRPILEGFQHVLRKKSNMLSNQIIDREICRSVNRCGLGTSLGSIGYDGSIFGCQEQTSKKENNIFYIGNIYENGIDQEKHKKLLTLYNKKATVVCENQELCTICPLNSFCTGFICPSLSYDLYEDYFISPEIMCKWKQILYQEALQLNNILTLSNNFAYERFLKYKCFKNKNKNKKVENKNESI